MSGEPIAITGISCRFPGGISGGLSTPQSFWEFVLNGGDAIRPVPDARKSLWEPWPDAGDFPGWGGYVDGIDRFDAAFFSISPREARHIDPQQRVLLELAWEALEDARIPPARLEGRPVGVYMGIFLDEYWDLQRYAAPSQVGMHTNTGGTLSIAANRISYFLDLKGPSIAVDTACSSSLTAIHLACRDIQAGTCTAALAGGANLLLTPQTTRGFEQARMLSPDGRCRVFDQAANGYGRSDGAGIVVLKRLSDAVEDGDAVYAVIHGSAINQDGRSRGLTVPGQNAQEAVIEAAARAGGVSAAQLTFVEAHGTGTPTGDPVEAMAIGRATGDAGCLIGSVKSNIGHTEAAAGVAGLIKAALALKHGILPPSLHFDQPNPDPDFDLVQRDPDEAAAV
ncbi:MAG: polyketide synthase, partial [Gemmatimonadota bacterium]|nr:polyketide synthase [Gemmatimonadota bacterium]